MNTASPAFPASRYGARLLRTSAALELMTGVALIATPSVVIRLLMGPSSGRRLHVLGRAFGGGLVSLGVAGLMQVDASPDRGVMFAFTIYNAATAATLGAAGLTGGASGVALWPVVAFHGGMAGLLAPCALCPDGGSGVVGAPEAEVGRG